MRVTVAYFLNRHVYVHELHGKGLRHTIRRTNVLSNLKTIEYSTFTDNTPLQMVISFEHNLNYDLFMVHVFKATINQSYCKYNTSLRQPQDARLGLVAHGLFWFFKSTNKSSSIQGSQTLKYM